MEITIWGVLTGAILPLIGYLVVHRLTISREVNSRYAKACNIFRESIIKSTSKIPEASSYWDNNFLEQLPEMVKSIEVATEIFKYFLPSSDRVNIDQDIEELKNIAQAQMPEALSRENVMYGGGQLTPLKAKEEFLQKIEKLKLYARKI